MVAGIPDKVFFKIGEVAKIVSLRPSVLRYWETEFELLRPVKSRTGQRLYTKKEVTFIFEIKKLLYVDKHTIDGAKKKISIKSKNDDTGIRSADTAIDKARTVINEIKADLLCIRDSL